MIEGDILSVGSRSGATLAALFFLVLFAGLGTTVAGSLRGRGTSTRAAVLAGVLAFAVPMSLLYAGSLGGFYEIEATRDGATLVPLLVVGADRVERGGVARVEARPTFKNRWRVHVVLNSGEELASAQSSRDTASRAVVVIDRSGTEKDRIHLLHDRESPCSANSRP
jgi:hypothetical protein